MKARLLDKWPDAVPSSCTTRRAITPLWFGDEAAVQDELAWCGEDVQVTGDEADSVGGTGAVVDGESVPGGELVGQSGPADAVAAVQGEGAVFSGELVEVHQRASGGRSGRSVNQCRTAYWIMRLRRLGSRPSAKVHTGRG